MNKRNYTILLEALRQATGDSQAALAERLGVTKAALSRWLHGHAQPQPRHRTVIERLHRQIVQYPAYDEAAVQRIARAAERFRRPGLWKWISVHEGVRHDLLLEHTYNSTTIEGTTFTKRETEAVIFAHALFPEKPLVEHLEVTNHAAVLGEILEGGYDQPLSEPLVKTLHRALLQGISPSVGRYSRHHRAIRGVDLALTHPKDIPEEMAGLLRGWRRHRRVTLREIARFHAAFELIHPFGDGNGRVGRLLMTIQCLQRDLPPIVIENARRAEYYDVLEYAQRTAEGPFAAFLADELSQVSAIVDKHTGRRRLQRLPRGDRRR
jgi:Fic family protein